MSSPALSVVIPCLNEVDRLPRTLARVLEAGDGCEVVVVDGGSTDGTWELAAGYPRVRFLRALRSRGVQLNAGAAAVRGETLLFLHADSVPPAGFGRWIAWALDRPGVIAGSFCLAFDADAPALRCYSWCSRINRPLFTYGDQGLFLRRSTFQGIGGYAPIPLLEDVEIQRRLRRRGRFAKVRVPVVTSARRFQAHGVLRQQAINALLLLAFHAGERPAALARLYQSGGGPRAIAAALGASALRRLRTRAARHLAGRELFDRREG